MRRFSRACFFAASAFLLPIAAKAAPLTVVNVGAPAINCKFNTSCTVTVSDSLGTFTPPGDGGVGRLQSRTYPGVAPAPMAGKTAFVYRVDLTSVTGSTCVNAIQFNFAALASGPYAGPADLFVITSGGLGTVAVSSATRAGGTGTTIVNFPGAGVCPGQTSYFFGLASTSAAPSMASAKLFYTPAVGQGTASIRVP